VTSSSPVPFTTVTEENIHAKVFFDPQFEFVYPAGTASLLHSSMGGQALPYSFEVAARAIIFPRYP